MNKIWRKMPAALAAGAAVLTLGGCAGSVNGWPVLGGVNIGVGSGGGWGGVTMSTPIGSPTSPVSGTIGLGRGSGGWGWGSGVGVGVSMGGSTVLNRSDDNAPADTLPAPAGTPVQQAPAGVWSPVTQGGTAQSPQAQVVNEAPEGSAFRNWPWGVQRVSP